jgi:transposase InsO family protein
MRRSHAYAMVGCRTADAGIPTKLGNRPNQVWAADITYIPLARGFLYLVVVMDWRSRYVLAWRLSNTMDTSFCLDALEDALRKGRPEIFNTDQGAIAKPRSR